MESGEDATCDIHSTWQRPMAAAMTSIPRLRVALVRTLLREPTVGVRVQQAPLRALQSFRSLTTEQQHQRQVDATNTITTITPNTLDTTSTAQAASTFQLPEDATTVGHILEYINTQCKDETTNAHIQALIIACSEPRDLNSLLHAITTFKRTRNYVMTTETANMAIAKALECHTKLEGSLWVLENFKERTGLYYSASTGSLNTTLDKLYEALMDEEETSQETKDRVWKALTRLTQGLLQRRCPPRMKKRAKRAYYRSLQDKIGGPRQRTVRRVAQIGIMVKSPEETWETLVEPFQEANVLINEKTIAWMEKKRSGESEQDEGNEESSEPEERVASEGDSERSR